MGAPVRMSKKFLQEQAAKAQARQNPAIIVENCALEEDAFVDVSVFGQKYYIPPQGAGTHPRTGEYSDRWGGQLRILDTLGVKTDKDNVESITSTARDPNARRNHIVKRGYEIAAKIVEFRQDVGVFQVTGDDDVDAAQRQAATERWCQWRLHDASKRIGLYYKRQEMVSKHPGHKFEPMQPLDVKAQDFIDAYNEPGGPYDQHKGVRSGFQLQCVEMEGKCGYGQKSTPQGKDSFLRHMRQTHKMTDDESRAKYAEYFEDQDEAAPKSKGKRK